MKMANAVSEAEMSDVDWLVARARSFPRSDPYSTKAWLITAKSLFPQSFVIQFESYLLEKAAKNVNEAARHLQDMLLSFPFESRLWVEVHSILESLRKDHLDSNSGFLTSMFAAIPTTTQCQMLLKVSETITDVLERCQLLLMAMEKFPNLIQEHGLKLVEMLVTEESNSGIVNSPVNCYRKLLVCDVMPLVLEKSGHLEVNKFHLCIWLQRAIEFYISYVSQPANSSDSPVDGSKVSNENSTSSLTTKNVRGLAALAEADMQVADPWGSLFKLLVMIGHRLSWDIERDLVSKSRDYQIQSLNHQLLRAKSSQPPETNSKQILYTAMVLFVYSMINYVGQVDPDACHIAGSTHQGSLILLEGFTKSISDTAKPSHPKKSKPDKPSQPTIHPSTSISAPAVILHHFETAILCVDLLNSTEEMKFEFFSLRQNWQKETQMIMNFFQIDMNIYQGNHDEALSLIQNPPFPISSTMKMRKMSLQTACCYFCQKNYRKACELIMEISDSILNTPNTSILAREGLEDIITTNSNDRSIVLLHSSDSELFLYCLQVFIAALKDKMYSSQREDTILAHLIILLQYNWPVHEALFSNVVSIIQKQNSFTYNLFFSYVHQVDILEEFAFLDTPEGGKVNLDIMPISTKALAQQRTVTRGVNKGVKEDFKAALEKQVGTVVESTDVVIKRFLNDEKTEILQTVS